MIPNADQLKTISQMAKGDLSEVPFPVLLHALAVYARSASLVIERRQLQKQIILDHGVPVDCQSNLLQDTLGKFMVGRGVLTEEQNHEMLSESAKTGRPFGELLVEAKLIAADELAKLSQQSLAKKLLDAFTWRSGTFHVSSTAPAVESSLKVKAPQLVLTGITKFAPEAEIAEAMAALDGDKILINPTPPFPLKELRLSKDHQEILGLVSLGKTIDELVDESGMPRNVVLRLLYALAVIGVALPEEWIVSSKAPAPVGAAAAEPGATQPVEELPRAKPSAPASAAETAAVRPATATDAAAQVVSAETEAVEAVPDMDFVEPMEPGESAAAVTPELVEVPVEDVDLLRNEIMEAYLRYRDQDPFDLLGIDGDTSREDVERAYLAFSEKMAPWRLKAIGLEDFTDKARELFVAGGRAFGELCNPETRKSILARRTSAVQKKLVPDEARNAFAIKSNLLDSETQFNKGIAQMKAGRFADAIELLQFAHDCEPQNSDYRAELAFCKYRKDPQLERDHALQELTETIRIEPDAGLALYYAGTIHGETGEFQQAEPLLQRAIKLMQPDRRPIDALRKFKAGERDKPKKKRRFF